MLCNWGWGAASPRTLRNLTSGAQGQNGVLHRQVPRSATSWALGQSHRFARARAVTRFKGSSGDMGDCQVPSHPMPLPGVPGSSAVELPGGSLGPKPSQIS